MANALILMENGTYSITERGVRRIEQLARQGAPLAVIARSMGIAVEGLNGLRKRDPRVQDAIDAGRGEVTKELTGLLMEHARKGNIAAIIFGLKTFGGFREGNLIDGSTPVTNNTQFNITIPPKMTPAEFESFMKTITKEPTT